MTRHNNFCFAISFFDLTGCVAPGLHIGIGQVAFFAAQRFQLAAAKEDLFRWYPGYNIIFCMGLAKIPADDPLPSDC